jgi:hypothetical protein
MIELVNLQPASVETNSTPPPKPLALLRLTSQSSIVAEAPAAIMMPPPFSPELPVITQFRIVGAEPFRERMPPPPASTLAPPQRLPWPAVTVKPSITAAELSPLSKTTTLARALSTGRSHPQRGRGCPVLRAQRNVFACKRDRLGEDVLAVSHDHGVARGSGP